MYGNLIPIFNVSFSRKTQSLNQIKMNPNNIKSGWWLIADGHFVTCYDSKEEAIKHIKCQKEIMHSKANWCISYIKINFGEFIRFPYEKDSTI